MREKLISLIYMKKINLKPLLFLFLLFVPFLVSGQVTIPNPLGYDTFGEVINAIVVFIRNVALALAPLVFIYAGLKYFFSGGDPKEAQKAADLIKWAIIGLAIILIANGITSVIIDVMGVNN